MKKFFAILLAVLMTASLSVVGMAEEGIQTYGGGGWDVTLRACFTPVTERRGPDGYIFHFATVNPDETAENSVEGMVEWSAPKTEFEITADELVKEGIMLQFSTGAEWVSAYIPQTEITSITAENGKFSFRKNNNPDTPFYVIYTVKLSEALTETGTIEDTIAVTVPKTYYKEMNNVADKNRGNFTFKFPVAITVTGDIPTGGGSTGGGSSDDHDTPPATENAANDDKTLDKLAAGESAEVKLTSGSAALATDTMDTLGSHGGKLTVTVDKMTVAIPGGFGKVNEPGRIYYPLDFSDSLATAADLAAAVKGEKAKTEVVKAGGDMVMPTTVTVTLKTKLTGTVNVYHYNDTTRRYTLLASPAAKDGKITFATKQMGTMVLTTGTI